MDTIGVVRISGAFSLLRLTVVIHKHFPAVNKDYLASKSIRFKYVNKIQEYSDSERRTDSAISEVIKQVPLVCAGATGTGTAIIESLGSAPSTPSPKAVNATNGTITVHCIRIQIYLNTGASHDLNRIMVPLRFRSIREINIDPQEHKKQSTDIRFFTISLEKVCKM